MNRVLLMCLLTVLPIMSFAEKAQTFEVAPYEFEITGENSVSLIKYYFNREPNPDATELVLPKEATFEGKSYAVTSIATVFLAGHKSWFAKNKQITSIRIPLTVHTIGYRAFACMKLESVTIPESVIHIGESAFADCPNLRYVEILAPEITIGHTAFYECTGLCLVKINSDHLKMEPDAFWYSQQLIEIQVKNAVRPYINIKNSRTNPKPLISIIDEPQQTVAPTNRYIAAAPAAQQPIAETPKIISDVDQNIPLTTLKNDKTFAVIIANEKYTTESTVNFALNDGKVFKEYCEKTLGIPTENIRFVENGTLGSIGAGIGWLKKVLEVYKQDANAIVYYSGHGIPNEANGDAYILPTDCQGSDFQYAYSINRLYKELGEAGAKSATYFIDACFSGTQRKGEMMVAARGVAIKAKSGVLSGNSVAFAAASGDETAFAYEEKGHGMFTYFLLKKLQETKGQVSYGELADYIQQNVKQKSIVVSPRLQSPNAISSTSASDSWHGWSFVK